MKFQDKLTNDFNYTQLCSFLRNNINFAFSRFGDGELAAIWKRQKRSRNCDGHNFFPEMGDALLNILKSNPYYNIGLQRLGFEQNEQQVNKLKVNWCKADMLHHNSIKGRLDLLFESLVNRNIIFVAPLYLKKINKKINYKHFIEIPEKNCWLHSDIVISKLHKIISKNDVVIFCASMAANVWVDKMYHMYNDSITLIDAGSVFDPYVNVDKRGYHKSVIERLKK